MMYIESAAPEYMGGVTDEGHVCHFGLTRRMYKAYMLVMTR